MPGISIHVVDVSRGIVAAGMRVELRASLDGGFDPVLDGEIDAKGHLVHPALSKTFQAGRYRAVFHVGDYYRDRGVTTAAIPFLDVVNFDFGIADPEQHFHLPLKCTPWGYSCFRGGA
ncbi:MAG: HIUase/Transthyretin family protein [Tardiphaga sp.]|jgi:5-hydroxyisourate hydrolase|nr:HIUase/Transthyretin family protein [Tardiphaga sp.]